MKNSISYAITACDEHEELQRLLRNLTNYAVDDEDEIVVQVDEEKVTDKVLETVKKWESNASLDSYSFRWIKFPLKKNFADFKNNLMDECKKDYIFFIDADEYPSNALMTHLKELLASNPVFECLHVPRVNTVSGITKEHISKWRWQVDSKGRINYPDYQTRVVKKKSDIRWEGKVHERLKGCMIYTYLPADDEGNWSLFHPKDIKRQEKQNALYDTI